MEKTNNQVINHKLSIVSLVILSLSLLDYEKQCFSFQTFCINYPYGFYTFLKITLFGYFGFGAYSLHKIEKISYKFIVFLLLAILYNPIIKVLLNRDIWYTLNITSIISILIIIALTTIKEKKQHNFK